MQKRKISRRAAIDAVITAAGLVVLVLGAAFQRMGIGQEYQNVLIDGISVGFVSNDVAVREMVREVRREMAAESEERLSMDYTWEVEPVRTLFQEFLTEAELKEAIRAALEQDTLDQKTRVYTVAIEDYRANFRTLDEVVDFLNRVKDPSDEQMQYEAEVSMEDTHISGVMSASLKDTAEADAGSDVSLGGLDAGIVAAVRDMAGMEDDALAEDTYQTGILAMEFVEKVEVYENYVDADEVSDVAAETEEVTKKKESNKIYQVESGDCLSVIAMDHDTTVSSILALNGLESADAIIREGQELVIAVPEPDLQLRVTKGEVYEEDYEEEAIILENDSWYTNQEVVRQEGTVGHRERNDIVIYENGIEVSREMLDQNIMVESQASIIERGTVIPPTYIKPLSGGSFSSGYGRRWGRMHKGVDWACPTGTTVFASSAGTVISAAYSSSYGYNVVISHPDGRMTRYAHNSKLLVHVGQTVKQGEKIALSGSTGRSTGPHVHFEIIINGSQVDPLKYIGN